LKGFNKDTTEEGNKPHSPALISQMTSNETFANELGKGSLNWLISVSERKKKNK